MAFLSSTSRHICSALLALGLTACSGLEDPVPTVPTSRVSLTVAPLSLQGVGVACYDLEVTTASDTVWARGSTSRTVLGADQSLMPALRVAGDGAADTTAVCSDRFGNGSGGEVTWVGPCDASAAADTVDGGVVQNRVTLRVDGLYDAAKTADLADWQDPCPGGCSIDVDCVANQDTLARIDLTLMRRANQGFFDVAVNFQDIFCSAKFDTCYEGDRHIELLLGEGLAREWTGVFGFACTGGPNANTVLGYSTVAVVCGDTTFTLDPSVAPGSNHVAQSGSHSLQYGVYRGAETLACDDATTEGTVESCGKRYWNLALSLEDLPSPGPCTLSLTATATDNNRGFDEGLPVGAGVSYPYVDVSVVLGQTCVRAPLGAGLGVETVYRGNLAGQAPPVAVCDQYDGTTVTNACPEPVAGSCPCWSLETEQARVAATLTAMPDLQVMSFLDFQDDGVGQGSVFDVLALSGDGALIYFAGNATAPITESGESGFFCQKIDDRISQEGFERVAFQPLTQAELDTCRADVAALAQNPCVVANGGCTDDTPICQYMAPATSVCLTCRDSADCVGNTAGSYCDFDRQQCVPNSSGRWRHTATSLADGRVLVLGDAAPYNPTVEIFAADGLTWSVADPIPEGRYMHTATLLDDGRVFVAGGYQDVGLETTYFFDPSAQAGFQWSLGPELPDGIRYGHTATLLADGKVLIAGGWQTVTTTATAWVFDPVALSFAAADMNGAHAHHTATRLADGSVVVIGRVPFMPSTTFAERFDPTTGDWTGYSVPAPFDQHLELHTANLLPNGDIFVVGYGLSFVFSPGGSGGWTAVSMIGNSREHHRAVTVGNRVVVFGGYDRLELGDLVSVERVDPAQNSALSLDPFFQSRSGFTATPLPNGKVLVVGGLVNGQAQGLPMLFDPTAANGNQWWP